MRAHRRFAARLNLFRVAAEKTRFLGAAVAPGEADLEGPRRADLAPPVADCVSRARVS